MADESYAESLRAAIIESGTEVASLDKVKELVLAYRRSNNLVRPDDFELMKDSKTDLKWEHRVRAALMDLRKRGECALVGRAKYRFFL